MLGKCLLKYNKCCHDKCLQGHIYVMSGYFLFNNWSEFLKICKTKALDKVCFDNYPCKISPWTTSWNNWFCTNWKDWLYSSCRGGLMISKKHLKNKIKKLWLRLIDCNWQVRLSDVILYMLLMMINKINQLHSLHPTTKLPLVPRPPWNSQQVFTNYIVYLKLHQCKVRSYHPPSLLSTTRSFFYKKPSYKKVRLKKSEN